ncbi:MAG: DNA-directed RNA polymerase subunit N [Thermoplasmata archaeon]|nr:MAG: DNA-directed RNA polymerase subunit N [Thermoplasmata archaeon]
MIVPVRCFTCGKVIGDSFEAYVQRIEMGEEPKEILDSLGVKRYCCRKMLISHADLIDEVMSYG